MSLTSSSGRMGMEAAKHKAGRHGRRGFRSPEGHVFQVAQAHHTSSCSDSTQGAYGLVLQALLQVVTLLHGCSIGSFTSFPPRNYRKASIPICLRACCCSPLTSPNCNVSPLGRVEAFRWTVSRLLRETGCRVSQSLKVFSLRAKRGEGV
jgi:hypothetical protein